MIWVAFMVMILANARAGEYKVTHLKPDRVFKGTTLLADMSDPENPKVVEVDFKGTVLWKYRPLQKMAGAVLEAAQIRNHNILITIAGSGIFEISRDKKGGLGSPRQGSLT